MRARGEEPIPWEGRLLRAVQNQRLRSALAQQLAKLAREVGEAMPAKGRTAAGDARRLRGVPVQGKGISGTSPGTQPEHELLRKEEERARRCYDE